MRRFWKTVGVESRPQGTPSTPSPAPLPALHAHPARPTGQYAVMLDQRTLKTPGGVPLTIPKERLPVALCIADEWENQTAVLKPHTLPMVSRSSNIALRVSALTAFSAGRLRSRHEHSTA